MRIINATPDRTIQLGYEGEDNVTKIIFRYGKDWPENGEGIFNIRVRRHGEHTAYNAQLVADDAENSCLLMTVTNTELSVRGAGEMQVVYSGENFIKKSPIYSYNVSRAVDEVADPPAQDVYTQIIESLSDLQTDVQGLSDAVDGIGNLKNLTTETKTDLVSAINEVNAKGGGGGGGLVTVDDALSTTSTNPVQNKVVTSAIQGKADIQTVSALADAVNGLDDDVQGLQTAMQSKADTETVTALSGTVSGLQTAIQSKADAQTVTTLSGTVTSLQTSKADKSYVDTQLAEKASAQTVSDLSDDVSDLQTGLSEKVGDVQINGTSVVNDGVANVPIATESSVGVCRADGEFGTGIYLNRIFVAAATDAQIKASRHYYRPIVPDKQHMSVFYGLAKAAGDTTQPQSSNAVGTYTEEAKTAIRTMLGLQEMYEWYKNQT